MNQGKAFAVVLVSFALSIGGASTVLAGTVEDPGDNGIVYMVHGHFEPAPEDGPPPIQEAFGTTQEDGEIVLHVIPYSVETEAPVDSGSDVEVVLEGPAPDQRVVVEPREGNAADDQRCVDETTIEGHEGDVSDCLVVEVDAERVRGWTAVDVTLRGTVGGDAILEPYSSPAHVAIHTTMAEGQPGFETADQLSGLATPILVEDLVDPVGPG